MSVGFGCHATKEFCPNSEEGWQQWKDPTLEEGRMISVIYRREAYKQVQVLDQVQVRQAQKHQPRASKQRMSRNGLVMYPKG